MSRFRKIKRKKEKKDDGFYFRIDEPKAIRFLIAEYRKSHPNPNLSVDQAVFEMKIVGWLPK